MSELVARTGRHQQRYEAGYRLIAGSRAFSLQGTPGGSKRFMSLLSSVIESKKRKEGPRCIPFRFRNMEENAGETSEKIVEVLMINSTSGPGLLFPKGGWENDETVEEAAIREAIEEAGVRGDLVHFLGYYFFKSKTLQDEFSPEGLCRAAMFALLVKEELECWPEQSLRRRSWLTIPEAIECCRHPWMRQALEEGFLKWHDSGMASTMNNND